MYWNIYSYKQIREVARYCKRQKLISYPFYKNAVWFEDTEWFISCLIEWFKVKFVCITILGL